MKRGPLKSLITAGVLAATVPAFADQNAVGQPSDLVAQQQEVKDLWGSLRSACRGANYNDILRANDKDCFYLIRCGNPNYEDHALAYQFNEDMKNPESAIPRLIREVREKCEYRRTYDTLVNSNVCEN
jgi:hypothetical protein